MIIHPIDRFCIGGINYEIRTNKIPHDTIINKWVRYLRVYVDYQFP